MSEPVTTGRPPDIAAASSAPQQLDSGSPRPWGHIAAGVALSVAAGLLGVVSIRAHHPPLIWVAFVPAIVAQHRVLPRRWSMLAPALAIGVYYQGYFTPALRSIGTSVPIFERVLGLWIGAIVLLLCLRSRSFHESTSYRWFVLSTPVAWASIDFIRTLLPTAAGATAGFVANALYDHPALVQPISIFTLHALNLLVLMVNYAVALVVIRVIDRRTHDRTRSDGRRVRFQVGAVGLVLAAWISGSVVMLHNPPATVKVAAVQTLGHDPGTLEQDIALTRQAAAQGARMVVWHEGGLRFDPRVEQSATFQRLAHDLGIYLVIGWAVQHPDSGVNESTVFGPTGDVIGTYGKMHPVTLIGEHSDVHGMFPRMQTPFGLLGTVICADLDYTDVAHRWARTGVGVLAIPSNDIGGGLADHYTRLVMRAVENRVTTIKADGGFDSAIVDPYGRILARRVTPGGSSGIVIADVPVGSGRTFASRAGDWFGYVLLVALVAFLGYGLVARRRARAAVDAAPPIAPYGQE